MGRNGPSRRRAVQLRASPEKEATKSPEARAGQILRSAEANQAATGVEAEPSAAGTRTANRGQIHKRTVPDQEDHGRTEAAQDPDEPSEPERDGAAPEEEAGAAEATE